MMGPAELPSLQARLTDPSKIPTSPLLLEIMVTIYLTAALAYVTYGLRMYSRITSKQTGLEDWLMTAATILSMAFMSVQYLYLRYNCTGLVASKIPATYDKEAALFSTWLSQVLYSPILGLIKSSTLIFVLRIAGHVRNIKWSIHVINAINICLTIASVFVTIFSTIPISAYWDAKGPAQHKINYGAFIASTSCLTILTDVLVLSIPVWAFIRTQLPLPTRLGVIMIFMTGGLVTAIGIVRFCVLAEQYWEPPKIRFMNTWGPSYSAIETNLAIVTACLPAMLPLLRTWFPRLFGNSSNGGSGPFQQQQQQRRRRWRRYSDEGRRGNESGVMMQGLCHTRAELHGGSKSPTDSREEMLKSPGIRMTTDIHVTYSDIEASAQKPVETKGRDKLWNHDHRVRP